MALDVLISIGGKIAELLVEPIGRRLMFIILPSKNIPKLKSKAEELEALRKGVQELIDPATRNGLEIREDVNQWTERVDKLIEETKLIPQGGSDENNKCLRFIPNPATRYHKGKWAEEKTKELDELLPKGGNFINTNIAKPAPHLGIEALLSTGSVDTTYAAFRSAREQVMEALRDENINFIAIHGIGGVGKTTLVVDIWKKVKEDKLFDEVVFGVVSQNQDIKRIQREIASMLGLSLTDEPEIMIRATRLCERIKQVGTILVILDDVWDKLDLKTVGIPSDKDHQGCKIIITTRRKQVCSAMGAVGRRKTVALNVLSDEDSWDLFRSRAGSENVDSPKLNAIAKEVWRECGHLPLALVTVGSAMSGKEDPDEWKEAARQLKDAAPHDIEDVEEHLYKNIKPSFDYLENETTKNLILLCTLFPEDHDICIEDMVRYGWGLKMFRGGSIDTVQGARLKMKAMVNNLKEASLLLTRDKGGEFVKMHDVVRDVAIRIGSEKYISVAGSRSLENWPSMMRETMDKYEGISLMGNEIDNYPTVWDFPKLKILLLVGKGIGSLSCEHYLSKLKKLNVLHVSSKNFQYLYADRIVLGAGHYAVSHLQTCLRTLILRGIDGPDIAAIGKITALEILDLKGCRFHDTPNASWIRALTNLRVLDLERTEFPNLLAGTSFLSPDLTCLEELYVDGTLSWDDMKIARNLPRLKVLNACTPDTTYAAFRSAREPVMEALRDENINFIAIHGIPGVGKTILVTDIWEKVKEDKLFDEVVIVMVSQNQDIKKIQRQIASMLGLSLTDEPEIMIRATRLCERIKQVGTILVILDDVWDKLDLQTVGIPSDVDHQGCKIIITTRRKQVCSAMGAVGRRKTVALNVLSDEDSWDLFSSRAGSEKVNSHKLNAIAKEVCRECGHLPLALDIVGRAMSGKEDPDEWKEAARQLKVAAPDDIEGVEQRVYNSIKLSFDYVKDQTAKNVVLLCTLFPEDHNIRIEDMVRYGWGLKMFGGGSIDTVQGARLKMKAMINNLKEESLLLPSDEGGEFVKMHDVVRDVAIRIGSGKYISVAGSRSLENWPSMMRETIDKYEGISLMGNETDNYPTVWDFPKLKILLLVRERIGSLSCEHFLSKLKELNVLHLSPNIHDYLLGANQIVLGDGHYAISHLQTCLRTLILRWIDGTDIAAIGKITTLEILDLKGCRFHDAPNASWIRALTNLRVLDLERTEFPNLLADSSFLSPDLTCLEELYVKGRLLWDDMKIARNLPRLKVLMACTPDIETMPPDFVFPHQLETFCITLGYELMGRDWDNHTPTLILNQIEKESTYVWRGSLTTLLTKCRSLTIWSCKKMDSIFPDLSARADDLKLLTRLLISDCDEFRSIINTNTSTADQQLLLSSLEYLRLGGLPRLEYIFKHSSSVSLCNLKRVIVEDCGILKKYLFQPAVAQSLVQLEVLSVDDCSQLGEIVGDDQGEEEKTNDNNNVRRLEFPNLKQVFLESLPELRGFCCSRGHLLFDWPSLERLQVINCPKMTTFARTSSSAGTPKLRSVHYARRWNTKEEMIPQGMDLNQFLLLKNAHGGGAEEIHKTSDT